MGRISKYSQQEKLKAVLDYKGGKRKIPEICQDLGLHKSGKDVYQWVTLYEDYGEEAFLPKPKNNSYSKEMKDMVIKDYFDGKGSYKELARAYGVSSPSVVGKWIKDQIDMSEATNVSLGRRKNSKETIRELQKENRELKKRLEEKKKEKYLWEKIKTIESEQVKYREKQKTKYMAVKEFHETKRWSINWMCQELKVTRTGYYKWLNGNVRMKQV